MRVLTASLLSTLLVFALSCSAFEVTYTFSSSAPTASGQASEASGGASIAFYNSDALSNPFAMVVDGQTAVFVGPSGSGSFVVGSHSLSGSVLTLFPVSGDSFPSVAADGDTVSFSGDALSVAQLSDVCNRLDTLNSKTDTSIFLLTAAAFTLGGLLGFASWAFVLRAQSEEDF